MVAQSGPAFQSCIEQQLKRTPNFRGGKVNLVATVGASGTVKQARLDRKELDAAKIAGPGAGDPSERAAWALVARAVLNLDEFVTKG